MFNIFQRIPLTRFNHSTFVPRSSFGTAQASVMGIVKLTPYMLTTHFDSIKKLHTDTVFINKISDTQIEITTFNNGSQSDTQSLQGVFSTVTKIYEITKCPEIELNDVKFLLKRDSKQRYISSKLVEKYIADIFYDAAKS